MKIIFLDTMCADKAYLEPIFRLGEVTAWFNSSPKEALQRVKGAEVLIVNKVKVTDELLEAAGSQLRLICEAATGVNNIDLQAAARRGIPVKNVAGYSTESVVQITFCHILSLMSDSQRFDAQVKDLSYSRGGIFTDISNPYTEMAGKTIGIVGMGTIGQRVAQVADAFGMKVIYFSTSGTGHCKDYPCVELDELLERSDVISIHAPMNERTNNLFDAPQLGKMKPTAIIVNMGRGGIVNENALARAIDNGTVAGAALDVFATEPLPENHPLLHTKYPERLRFSPHVAWASAEAIARLFEGVAQNIRSAMPQQD